jgi:hypothetical protein
MGRWERGFSHSWDYRQRTFIVACRPHSNRQCIYCALGAVVLWNETYLGGDVCFDGQTFLKKSANFSSCGDNATDTSSRRVERPQDGQYYCASYCTIILLVSPDGAIFLRNNLVEV